MVLDEPRVTDLSAVSGVGRGGDMGWRAGRRSEGGSSRLGCGMLWTQVAACAGGDRHGVPRRVTLPCGRVSGELVRVTQTTSRGALRLGGMGGPGALALGPGAQPPGSERGGRCRSWTEMPGVAGRSVTGGASRWGE